MNSLQEKKIIQDLIFFLCTISMRGEIGKRKFCSLFHLKILYVKTQKFKIEIYE
jgi:hypothetical protein